MVTNSSIAWEIPRTEEPARQQSMRCRVGPYRLQDRERCFQLPQNGNPAPEFQGVT